MTVRIRPVESRRVRRDFLDLPARIYSDDPNWIAPLRHIEARRLSPRKHPFYEHGRGRFWVAYRNGDAVGRIGAVVNDLHLARYGDATGHFAMLESTDDEEVFARLVAAAGDWLRAQGMRAVAGPFNLSTNEEVGALVDGFDAPPMIMMGHGRPYYARLFDGAGFTKLKDLYAFRIDIADTAFLDAQRGKIAALCARAGVVVRPSRRATLERDLRQLIQVFNEGWGDNWGFVPLTPREVDTIVADLKPVVDPALMAIAEHREGTVGVIAALPNINELLAGLDGRLLPFGWLRLLWRLRMQTIDSSRILLAGVVAGSQNTAVAGALPLLLVDAIREGAVRRGIRWVEASWVLEDNRRVIRICELGGFRRYKTYRIYGRSLETPGP